MASVPAAAPAADRLRELDALRGIAAMAVLLFHYTVRFYEIYPEQPGRPAIRFEGGHLGVHLFFIISGFVIFMTLERTRHGLDFVVSRFSRLYPAYWAAIALTSLIVLAFGLPGREPEPGEIAVNLTMIQGAFGVGNVDGVYWTLQVELCFYLAMWILHQLGWLARIVPLLGAWLGLCALNLLLTHTLRPLPGAAVQFLILNYIPFFALGIAFCKFRQARRWSGELIALIFASVVLIGLLQPWIDALITAGFCLLFYLFVTDRLRWITSAGFIFLGAISYPLYLLHQNIGYVMLRELGRWDLDANVRTALAMVVAIALASAVTYAIERPAMRYLRARYQQWRHRRHLATVALGTRRA